MEPNDKNNPLTEVNLANRDFQQPGSDVRAAANTGDEETDDVDDELNMDEDDLDDDDLDETNDEDIDGATTGDDADEDEEND